MLPFVRRGFSRSSKTLWQRGTASASASAVEAAPAPHFLEPEFLKSDKRSDYNPEMFVDFKPATTWNAVGELVNNLGSALNERHISAAFYQIKRIRARPPPEFMENLKDLAMGIKPGNFNCKSATLILQSCANQNYFDKDFFERVTETTMRETYKASFRDIARMMHALGLIKRTWEVHRNKGDVFDSIDAFVRRLGERLTFEYCHRQFDPVSAAILFQGLGHLNYDDHQMMFGLSQLLSHPVNLNKMCGREIATTLMALCRLKHKNMSLIRALFQRVVAKDLLPTFNEQELCNVTYALGHLGFRGDEVWDLLVEEVVRAERLSKYTKQGLCNLLHGLSTNAFKNAEFVDLIAREVARPSRLASFNIQDLTSTIHSIGKLQYPDWRVWGEIASELTKEDRLRNFDERGLASVMYGFGKSGFNRENFIKPLWDEIVQEDRLPKYSEQALSNIVYGAGKLGIKTLPKLDVFGRELVKPERLAKYTEQALSNLFYGLALLDFKHSDIVGKLMEEVVKVNRLLSLRQQAMSNILFAIWRLGYKDETLVKKFMVEFMEEGRVPKLTDTMIVRDLKWMGSMAVRDASVVDCFVNELMDMNRLQNMAMKDLAQAVYALGKLEIKDMSKIGVVAQEAMSPSRWSQMSDEDLGCITYGFGMLGYRDQQFWNHMGVEIIRPSKLATFRSQSMCSILNGFAKIGGENIPNLMTAVGNICGELSKVGRLGDWKPRDLSNAAWALASLRYYDPHVMNLICEMFLSKFTASSNNFEELGALLYACSALNHQYSKLINKCMEVATADGKSGQVDAQFLGNTIWSLAALGVLTPNYFEGLVNEMLLLRSSGNELSPKDLAQVSQGFLFLRSHCRYRPKNTTHSMFLADARQAHKQQVMLSSVTSDFHRDVEAVLGGMGVIQKTGTFLDDVCIRPDFVLWKNEDRILLEADGPSHFTCNEGDDRRLMGPTVLRNSILTRSGYKVFSIPEWHWQTLSKSDQKTFIADLLAPEMKPKKR
ncbi:hypothetical protein BSKO_02951 [Bryopsis sp. KO-2023]|nr:hypothetical protein BSKO_02951 [Bryopsis sp. KO-2023]